jgi:hypothetical protein
MTSGIRVKWLQAIETVMEQRARQQSPSPAPARSPAPSPARDVTTKSSSSSTSAAYRSPGAGKTESGVGVGGSKSEVKSGSRASPAREGNLKPRRLTMDSIRTESIRTETSALGMGKSGSKNHKHRTSCTWPYASSPERDFVDGQKPDDDQECRDSSGDRGRHNSTRSSRSRSESIDTGASDNDADITVAVAATTTSSYPTSSSSPLSPSSRSTKNTATHSPSRSKSPRAPSAKVKEKTKSHSSTSAPRPKSPPLTSGQRDLMVDAIVQQQSSATRPESDLDPDDDDPMTDIIEKKWREVSPQVCSGRVLSHSLNVVL